MKLSYRRTLEPTSLPVTTQDAMRYLRVEDACDATEVEGYLRVATEMVENYTARAFSPQNWTVYLDEFPGGHKVIQLPRAPAIEMVSFLYDDENDAEQTVSADIYRLDAHREPCRIVRVSGFDWPVSNGKVNSVRITYKAGYAANIPEVAKQAILFYTSHLYEVRGPVVVGSISSDIPLTLKHLMNQIRIFNP